MQQIEFRSLFQFKAWVFIEPFFSSSSAGSVELALTRAGDMCLLDNSYLGEIYWVNAKVNYAIFCLSTVKEIHFWH